MKKKIIVFDLDETLTETRSPITDEMAGLLARLLEKYQVCVISGGAFSQFEKQLLVNKQIRPNLYKSLHIMPTCGTRYFRFIDNKWVQIYAEDLNRDQKDTIIKAIQESMKDLSHPLPEAKGKLIDDRGSQITYQALGLDAPVEIKKAWDPTGEKKKKIRDVIETKIPAGFEVRTGGTTSIDITTKGMDKAYGMKKLIEVLGVTKEVILFIGDRIWEGGNDYPVKLMGIDTISVHGFEHTPDAVRKILAE